MRRVFVAILLVLVSACSAVRSEHVVVPAPDSRPAVEVRWSSAAARARDIKKLHDQIAADNLRRWYDYWRFVAAVRRNELLLIASVAPTIVCIKQHESGDPTEHSHPGSGSGAEQWIPSSWETWSRRAGYGGWPLAYMAPAFTQDYVTAWALTHGGRGNWSNRYGFDPCTGG